MLTEDKILQIYEEHNAVWFFDYRRGVPGAPHAVLTSGKHSDGYVNSTPVLENPENVVLLATELIERMNSRNAFHLLAVDWIVGSSYADITFSYEVARQLGVRHGFAEKNPWYDDMDPQQPKFIWNRFRIPGGALVLQIEELITTLGTAVEVRRAVVRGNPDEPVRFLPDVGTIIYRPPTLLRDSLINVISLVTREVRSWRPEDCPLCAGGSPAVKPKTHWAEFTVKQ